MKLNFTTGNLKEELDSGRVKSVANNSKINLKFTQSYTNYLISRRIVFLPEN